MADGRLEADGKFDADGRLIRLLSGAFLPAALWFVLVYAFYNLYFF